LTRKFTNLIQVSVGREIFGALNLNLMFG